MTADEQGSAEMHDHESEKNQNTHSDHVVSAARRRALKIGLASVPMILTLRNKPAFGADCTQSLMMSATRASHVTCTIPIKKGVDPPTPGPPVPATPPAKSPFDPLKR